MLLIRGNQTVTTRIGVAADLWSWWPSKSFPIHVLRGLKTQECLQDKGWVPSCSHSMDSCTLSVWPCCCSNFLAGWQHRRHDHDWVDQTKTMGACVSSEVLTCGHCLMCTMWVSAQIQAVLPVQSSINAHPESTSPAAVSGGPSAGCRRSWAPGCFQQLEAERRSAWSSSCF